MRDENYCDPCSFISRGKRCQIVALLLVRSHLEEDLLESSRVVHKRTLVNRRVDVVHKLEVGVGVYEGPKVGDKVVVALFQLDIPLPGTVAVVKNLDSLLPANVDVDCFHYPNDVLVLLRDVVEGKDLLHQWRSRVQQVQGAKEWDLARSEAMSSGG